MLSEAVIMVVKSVSHSFWEKTPVRRRPANCTTAVIDVQMTRFRRCTLFAGIPCRFSGYTSGSLEKRKLGRPLPKLFVAVESLSQRASNMILRRRS